MNPRQITLATLMSFAALVSIAAATATQTGTETFSATAAIKTAGGAQATAPVTITVTHKMSQAEADKYTSAFAGVAPTGSIQIGAGKATPTRLTLERPSDRGRMLTIVTDQPLMFVGAGMPNAKPKEGFDFGIVDIIVNDKGGSGTMSPAAKVTVKQGVFVVDEYSGELVTLTDVKKAK
jgi:hypothetical protein